MEHQLVKQNMKEVCLNTLSHQTYIIRQLFQTSILQSIMMLMLNVDFFSSKRFSIIPIEVEGKSAMNRFNSDYGIIIVNNGDVIKKEGGYSFL